MILFKDFNFTPTASMKQVVAHCWKCQEKNVSECMCILSHFMYNNWIIILLLVEYN